MERSQVYSIILKSLALLMFMNVLVFKIYNTWLLAAVFVLILVLFFLKIQNLEKIEKQKELITKGIGIVLLAIVYFLYRFLV
jgi:uncharacterized membrane protein